MTNSNVSFSLAIDEPIRKVLSALHARGCAPQPVKGKPDQWTARCPGHEDRKASLSVGVGHHGRVLVRCHAGCTVDAVVAAMGLGVADLFPAEHANVELSRQRPSQNATPPEWHHLLVQAEATAPDALEPWAEHLGVPAEALAALRAVPQGQKLLLPMFTGNGELCGWQSRTWAGEKRCLPRSKLGLFLPTAPPNPGQQVWTAEGASDTAALLGVGLYAVGRPSATAGADDLREWCSRHRPGQVVVVADADEAGQRGAEAAAAELVDVVAEVRIFTPPRGKDVRDFLHDPDHNYWGDAATPEDVGGHLERLAADAPTWEPPADDADQTDVDREDSPRPTQAQRLVAAAREKWDLFHYRGEPFAVLPSGRVVRLRSGDAEDALCSLAYAELLTVPGENTISTVARTLAVIARERGPEVPVFVRVGEHGGAVYVDGHDWVAEVTATGWQLVDSAPCYFLQPTGALPLLQPTAGGNVDALREYLPLIDANNWLLLKSWLLQALLPSGPYPVLLLCGEQGTGKSTVARMLRAVVDPHEAPLSGAVESGRDLFVLAGHHHVVALDNLSRVPGDLSDALCVLATGGAWQTRKLYTDGDLAILKACRPVVITSIVDVATRPDLLDRSLRVELAPIPDTKRKPEADLWGAFRDALPEILGGLLDDLVRCLARRDAVQVEALPRMADFTRNAIAAYGDDAGAAIMAAVADAATVALDGNPVAEAVERFATWDGWTGTASELLRELRPYFPDDAKQPQNASALGRTLRRLAPSLRKRGIDVTWEKDKVSRKIHVRRTAP